MDAGTGEGLPPGWAVAALNDVCEINPSTDVSGVAPDAAVTFVPMAAVGALTNTVDTTKSRPLREVTTGFTRFRSGDVIFAKITPCMENGKIALLPDLPSGIGMGSTEFHVLRPKPGIVGAYVCHYLMQESFRALARRSMSGAVGQQRVPAAFLREATIPLPPTAEQTRIVAAVNALFEEVEAGEAALARAREGLAQFRASLLHAACTGALTAEWRAANPTNETADDLLTAALDLRKKLWPGRYETPVRIAADMPSLPAGWRWATLDQLAILPARNGISVKGNPEPPGVAALRLDAMQGDGLDFTCRRYIDIPANKAADLAIREGDFLISRANGSLALMGRACVAGIPPVPTVFPDTMIRFRLASAELARWAAVAWRSVFVREHLERRAKTSAGIWKISQDDMRSAPIPLPPSHEITAILDALATAQVENSALPSDGFADALRQSILHAGFTGRLVPQDPADEPAAALLARLRAAPAAARRPRARRTTTKPDLIETPA